MKTYIKIFVIALAVVLVTGAVGIGVVLAEDPTPEPEYGPGWMMRNFQEDGSWFGRMGGRGMMGRFAYDDDDWEWMNQMHSWMYAGGGMHTEVWETLSSTLGLTVEELYDEVRSGKALAEIGEEKGFSRAELLTVLENAHQDALDKEVADGELTQEQADDMLSFMTERYEWMLDNAGFGGRPGFSPGFGGCHGGWNFNPDSSQDN